ncbi:hypothetical protein, partial [Kitasatospora sp. Root187]|uniref:hypothetical protein n=1 Tax=Kitasatospora sp. Root187 TaxID=1736486 RepID=UPI00138F972A
MIVTAHLSGTHLDWLDKALGSVGHAVDEKRARQILRDLAADGTIQRVDADRAAAGGSPDIGRPRPGCPPRSSDHVRNSVGRTVRPGRERRQHCARACLTPGSALWRSKVTLKVSRAAWSVSASGW